MNKKKEYQVQKIYEEYVEKVLSVMKKKLDVIAEFRVKAGKEKLQNLKKELKE